MTPEQETINRIYESWDETYFSQNLKTAIELQYGREILDQVIAIYDDLYPIGMGPYGMDESFRILSVVRERDYPWLSERAWRKLGHAMMMCWK